MFFNKAPKLDTIAHIQQALRKEEKKKAKWEAKMAPLQAKLQQYLDKHHMLLKQMKEASAVGNSPLNAKLTKQNLQNNQKYNELKKTVLALDHQLGFSLKNIARYERLIAEKEGRYVPNADEIDFKSVLEEFQQQKELKLQGIKKLIDLEIIPFEEKSEPNEDGSVDYVYKGIYLVFHMGDESIKGRIYENEQTISFTEEPFFAFGDQLEGMKEYVQKEYGVSQFTYLKDGRYVAF